MASSSSNLLDELADDGIVEVLHVHPFYALDDKTTASLATTVKIKRRGGKKHKQHQQRRPLSYQLSSDNDSEFHCSGMDVKTGQQNFMTMMIMMMLMVVMMMMMTVVVMMALTSLTYSACSSFKVNSMKICWSFSLQ